MKVQKLSLNVLLKKTFLTYFLAAYKVETWCQLSTCDPPIAGSEE